RLLPRQPLGQLPRLLLQLLLLLRQPLQLLVLLGLGPAQFFDPLLLQPAQLGLVAAGGRLLLAPLQLALQLLAALLGRLGLALQLLLAGEQFADLLLGLAELVLRRVGRAGLALVQGGGGPLQGVSPLPLAGGGVAELVLADLPGGFR